jgi:glycolate oxidase
VVTRGAGTGLSGGVLAIEGCVVLSTERMRAVEVDPVGETAVAQAGALNVEVKAAAARHGLWYPPDPSSFEISSIGGNAATNAGGLCCVKYGVTGDYVLGMQVVLADGRALRLGGKTVKNVVGYDLKRLFIGSEGTLGVITEVTLRLRPSPPEMSTAVATFADVASVGRAVEAIMRQGRPAVLEFMDRTAVGAVESLTRMGLDTDCAVLFARSDAGEGRLTELDGVLEACRRFGARELYATDDVHEGEQFMAARRLALDAAERQGSVLIEDVTVPLPRTAELLDGLSGIAEASGTMIATVGHAGDGNFHPVLVFDGSDAAAVQRARGAFDEIMHLVIGLGGAISGEHGIGVLKRPWLRAALGDDVLEVSHRIKDALDPHGILNPQRAI